MDVPETNRRVLLQAEIKNKLASGRGPQHYLLSQNLPGQGELQRHTSVLSSGWLPHNRPPGDEPTCHLTLSVGVRPPQLHCSGDLLATILVSTAYFLPSLRPAISANVTNPFSS